MIVKHTLLNYICNHSFVVLMLLFVFSITILSCSFFYSIAIMRHKVFECSVLFPLPLLVMLQDVAAGGVLAQGLVPTAIFDITVFASLHRQHLPIWKVLLHTLTQYTHRW